MFNNYFEYTGNLHMHTPYSDGEGSHEQIAKSALAAGLDFVVVTDHNILVQGLEGYYGDEKEGYVLLLTGEEVHDRLRIPQCNHLLVYGTETELAPCAADPQVLINAVNSAGGLCFIAHPHDPPLERIKQGAIPWVDWQVEHFTGLEIWNYMSSFKGLLNTAINNRQYRRAFGYLFQPEDGIYGPEPETLELWDRLLGQGLRVVGIGNSDAHATTYHFGPLRHVIFPYDFLFSCVNTHVLTAQPLSGDWMHDKTAIYKALRQGNAFISYDLVGSARGFRFSAHGQNGTAIMGGNIRLGPGVTLQALAYERSHIKLIRHGKIVAEVKGRENLTYTAHESGAYRVEVWREHKGAERAWILSNPIYIEDSSYTPR